jgi:hypothetical protein
MEGKVVRFDPAVKPGVFVTQSQILIEMEDIQLEKMIHDLTEKVNQSQSLISALFDKLISEADPKARAQVTGDIKKATEERNAAQTQLDTLKKRVNAVAGAPGHFQIRAPLSGTVLSWEFKENLTNKYVKPTEPLLRIGNKQGPWEIELKIPQKHIGQIKRAFNPKDPNDELWVDLLVASAPTETFKGKLSRLKIGGQAEPDKEEVGESEPVVLASVRIDGDDIPPAQRIPARLLTPGTEVQTKVRCGTRPMGYSLFYGLWEFFYEKVVFFF